ncbi:MAG: hypothetical protein II328_05145 [Clostridia bacterium]|nr:hypothetical protein [Clostridia bacterium]
MKRLILLLLSLLLLCGCAPQMGEESPLTPLDELKEQTQTEAIASESANPLNQKIILDFDSREEFATDSVHVTLKASASDHLDPPTAEDFPGIDISRIEYLVTGGYDIEKGKDWDVYFAVPGREPEYFRWRLRLYFQNPSEEAARAAVDVLNEMESVSVVENCYHYAVGRKTSFNSYQLSHPHYNDVLELTLEWDHSDPNVPYDSSDFEDFPAKAIRGTPYLLGYLKEPIIEDGAYWQYWEAFQNTKRHDSLSRFQGRGWQMLVELPPSSDEELKQYADRFLEYEAVRAVNLVDSVDGWND